MSAKQRKPMDLKAYNQRTQEGPCFICELLNGNPEYAHHIVFEDDYSVVFLARVFQPDGTQTTQALGYLLVAPKTHLEQVTGDFTAQTYLRLQQTVYRTAEALRRTLPAERIYVLSLGSQQGNRHVHWHVVALPPGVPYDEQQFHFLMAEHGVIDVSETEMSTLASQLRSRF